MSLRDGYADSLNSWNKGLIIDDSLLAGTRKEISK
jgi:hypothetical protein